MTNDKPRPIKRYSEEWWANYAHAENRCVAHRKNGAQCLRPARLGATVCRVHGGAAPQVMRKARERIELAADRMARELLGIATGAESEAVKLAAVKDALDRAGLSAKQALEVGVELRPYEHLLNDIAGVATITRAESQARCGLPADEPPTDETALEIVDAELVPEPPESRPGVARDERAGAGAPDDPDTTDATASGQPSRALVPLEDATAEAGQANRANAARIARVRRVR